MCIRDSYNTGWNWYGELDEVRVSKTARSAAWIKASYYSNWDNLMEYGGTAPPFMTFAFTNPVPVDLATEYGYRHLLKITVTSTGNVAPTYVNDISFYNASAVKIGSTVSGVAQGAQTTSTDYYFTPSASTNQWYAHASSSGFSDTSDLYTFYSKFVCAGYVEVDGTRTSGIPVRLYKRTHGVLVGSGISAGISGTFSIETEDVDHHYAVAIHPTNDNINAQIYDWLIPTIS